MATDWSYAAVAFIDVLGFSSMVDSDARAIKPSHLLTIRDLLAAAKGASPKLDIRAFSDSITVSAPLISDSVAHLVQAVVHLQRNFVSGGALVRGGVAFGKHFADDTLVYSEALIRAYALERDKARFPRILVAGDLLDWYFHDPATTDEQAKEVRSLLLNDRDDHAFLDYLRPEDLEKHLSLIQGYSVDKATPSVLEKVQWLCQYHNFVAARAGVALTYQGPMLDGFRELLVKP